jgi:predicted nucleotidyltransferase
VDTDSLLKSLNAHKVRYVILGATAFPIHGYARATLDIDIFIEPVKANAEKVRTALSEFGYDMTDVTVDDLLTQKILMKNFMYFFEITIFLKYPLL